MSRITTNVVTVLFLKVPTTTTYVAPLFPPPFFNHSFAYFRFLLFYCLLLQLLKEGKIFTLSAAYTYLGVSEMISKPPVVPYGQVYYDYCISNQAYSLG